MSFDLKRLKQATPREIEIAVPELADLWSGEGPPIWRIRAMSGDAIGFANFQASEEMQRRIQQLTAAISEGAGIGDALHELLGDPERVSPEAIKRTHFLVFGSVEPKIDFEAATRLRKACYPAFLKITDQIIILSGQGYNLGKSMPSGKSQKSNVP